MKAISVVISSCSRLRLLKKSIASLQESLVSTCKLNYILVEDFVDEPERRKESRDWLENNVDIFSKVVFLNTKAGFGKHFQEAVKNVESDFFFRMEDDQIFRRKIFLDPLLDILYSDNSLASISLRRPKDNRDCIRNLVINDIEFQQTTFFSDSLGLFNTSLTKSLIDTCGWDSLLHEKKVMTPASVKLGLKKFILGKKNKFKSSSIHYKHEGINERQGSYFSHHLVS
tara:strand:- start:156 stop:839 length:684 start_codon:yes stop_codon:yes gene_type:complete